MTFCSLIVCIIFCWASAPYLCFFFAEMKRYIASASCGFQKKSWVLDCVVWFIFRSRLRGVIRYNVLPGKCRSDWLAFLSFPVWLRICCFFIIMIVVSECERGIKLQFSADKIEGQGKCFRLRIVNGLLWAVESELWSARLYIHVLCILT